MRHFAFLISIALLFDACKQFADKGDAMSSSDMSPSVVPKLTGEFVGGAIQATSMNGNVTLNGRLHWRNTAKVCNGNGTVCLEGWMR